MDDGEKQEGKDAFFDDVQMKELHNQQVKYVEYLDGLVGGFFKKCPANTHFIITSDHGEHNYFGHGPIYHEKVFEFPFIEGVLAE